jgi:tRNA(Ile)-lysidine synthase TilS/MesJ
MAAWCVVRDIEYIIEECPLASGNRHLAYKEVMNQIEERSPGTKASFYLGFLDNMAPLLRDEHAKDLDSIGTCSRCSAPTGAADSELCAFCRLQERASQVDPIPVDLLLKKRRRS